MCKTNIEQLNQTKTIIKENQVSSILPLVAWVHQVTLYVLRGEV